MTKQECIDIFGLSDILELPNAALSVVLGDKERRDKVYEQLLRANNWCMEEDWFQNVYEEVEIIEWRGGTTNKSPAESNTAPRIYVIFDKNSSGLNEIAKYGDDHKKEWVIHAVPHNSKMARKKGEAVKGPHIHLWKNGHPDKVIPLEEDDPRKGLLQRIQNFQKLKQ